MSAEDEQKTRAERARAIGLFRYQLIREAADQVHSTKQRGRLVRAIAAAEHTDPFGRRVRVSRQTVDRWIRDWRAGGFDALVPNPRQSSARTPAEVMELAVGLRRENPDRTAAGIGRILRAQLGWSPDERTLQRHFTRLGLNRSAGTVTSVFGRFEAERPNDLWTGDALHGIHIGGRKTYLFAFIDDHSRAIVGYRFGFAEDTVRLAAALRPALAARGVPQAIYVDNGSAFVDAWLLRACASLGIKLTHSTPGRPQGRGKIERFFRTVRDQFHARDHRRARRRRTSCRGRSAGAEPVVRRVGRNQLSPRGPLRDRATAPGPLASRWPVPAAEAGGADRGVLWEERRTVTKTATVSLHGNAYQVDAELVGRKVELVFDPFDLTTVEVRLGGVPHGSAVPHHIGRHAHPKARPETPPTTPAPTGINYARLLDDAHQAELAHRVNYAALTSAGEETA